MPEAHDDHEDGCGCGAGLKATDAIKDADLPEARGGIAAALSMELDDGSDGCDFTVKRGEATGDEDLPEARGGMST